MPLATRIIPIILWDGNQAVNTTRFGAPRRIGSMQQTISTFEARQVDELIILDIQAHREQRDIDLQAMHSAAIWLSMPLAIGGGVNNAEIAEQLIRTCCDKIVLRTAIDRFRGHSLLRQLSHKLGSQAVVVACDVNKDGNVEMLPANGKGAKATLDAVKYCERCVAQGAGEILLTSIEHQGAMEGYDLNLIKRVVKAVDVPVIANGGCGKPEHMHKALEAGAHAVAATSMFAFTQFTPREAAKRLKSMGYEVRV